MKCTVCRQAAVIAFRRHNAKFCAEHVERFCVTQVERAIEEFDMFQPGQRLLIAVSGGKDSLAIWDILLSLGYEADGLYIGLGIDEYSDSSLAHVERFVAGRRESHPNLGLSIVDLRSSYGYDIPKAASATGRSPCSACGLTKRHVFDSETISGGYDALVTGHNLDDEAAVLFGNTLRWQTDYLARQSPVLVERNGFPRKVKPLVRLGERETAAYCVVRGIDYQVEECPKSAGNKHLSFKGQLNALESESPGTKTSFYFGFLRNVKPMLTRPDLNIDLTSCTRCGAPTEADVCSFCRLVEKASGAKDFEVASVGHREIAQTERSSHVG